MTLRRAIFGTWASLALPNTGPDHPTDSRFAYLDPSGAGLLKIKVPTTWTGKQILFKFVQFNSSGSGFASLPDVTAYPYNVAGTQNNGGSPGGGGTGGSGGVGVGSVYTISPANPLSQTSPTNIHMVDVIATFSPSNLTTFYAARDFTIPTPTGPTTYYVTVYDPFLTGDTGNSPTLTAFCTTSLAGSHVGQPGYIYMGSIVAQASGTSAGGTGGGSNPTGGLFILLAVPATTRGDFTFAHSLPFTPSDVDIKMTADGLIRFQPSPSPPWDATNIYLNASDDGLTALLVIEQ